MCLLTTPAPAAHANLSFEIQIHFNPKCHKQVADPPRAHIHISVSRFFLSASTLNSAGNFVTFRSARNIRAGPSFLFKDDLWSRINSPKPSCESSRGLWNCDPNEAELPPAPPQACEDNLTTCLRCQACFGCE